MGSSLPSQHVGVVCEHVQYGFTAHSYVRQGILFAMAMMLEATHGFVRELEDELAEVVQWLNGVYIC